MNIRSVSDAKKFDPARLVKSTLFETERMFCDVHGLLQGQEQRPHVHEDSDKIYFVLEGCGSFRIGGESREVGEKNVLHVPPGVEHSVRNDSPTPLALLVFMAPHPNYVRRPQE